MGSDTEHKNPNQIKTRMKKNLLLFLSILLIAACQQKTKTITNDRRQH